jgi:hypothetical protein
MWLCGALAAPNDSLLDVTQDRELKIPHEGNAASNGGSGLVQLRPGSLVQDDDFNSQMRNVPAGILPAANTPSEMEGLPRSSPRSTGRYEPKLDGAVPWQG